MREEIMKDAFLLTFMIFSDQKASLCPFCLTLWKLLVDSFQALWSLGPEPNSRKETARIMLFSDCHTEGIITKNNQLWLTFICQKCTQIALLLKDSFVDAETIIQKGGNSFLLKLATSVFCGSETWYTQLIAQSVPPVLPISYGFFAVCVLEIQVHVLQVLLLSWFAKCAMQGSQSCHC